MWIDSSHVDALIKQWTAKETDRLREIDAAKQAGRVWNEHFAVARQLQECIAALQALPRLSEVPAQEQKQPSDYERQLMKWNEELWAASQPKPGQSQP
jgi:hypothetical protein